MVKSWERARGRLWPRRFRPKIYTRLKPMQKLGFKLGFVFIIWLTVDTFIFWILSRGVCQADRRSSRDAATSGGCWSFSYALFFSVQAGFGVGWTTGFERRGIQLFSTFHCLVGEFFVLSAIELLFIYQSRKLFASELARRQAISRKLQQNGTTGASLTRAKFSAAVERQPIFGPQEYVLLYAWLLMVLIGTVYGVYNEDLPVASALLYSTSGLTTAGLVPPSAALKVRPAVPLVACSIYLLIGIPLTAALGSSVWSKYFTKYEQRTRRRRYYESIILRRPPLAASASSLSNNNNHTTSRNNMIQSPFPGRSFLGDTAERASEPRLQMPSGRDLATTTTSFDSTNKFLNNDRRRQSATAYNSRRAALSRQQTPRRPSPPLVKKPQARNVNNVSDPELGGVSSTNQDGISNSSLQNEHDDEDDHSNDGSNTPKSMTRSVSLDLTNNQPTRHHRRFADMQRRSRSEDSPSTLSFGTFLQTELLDLGIIDQALLSQIRLAYDALHVDAFEEPESDDDDEFRDFSVHATILPEMESAFPGNDSVATGDNTLSLEYFSPHLSTSRAEEANEATTPRISVAAASSRSKSNPSLDEDARKDETEMTTL